MKPIRGPIDYGGYPARKRRLAREAQLREAQAAPLLTPQQKAEQEAAREAEQIEHERAARLKSRSAMFRQATHDAHGFPTHGHVMLVPDTESDKATNANVAEVAAAKVAAAKVATPSVDKDAPSHSERAVQERRAELQRKADLQAARRDRNNPNWKRVRRLTWTMAGILGILCVGLALTRPEMEVRSVQVEGAHLVSPSVLEKIQAQFVGQNIFRARTKDAVAKLIALPVVKEARIRRLATWPPQMTISIVERKAFVRVGNERSWWVADEDGVPFRKARDEDSKLDAIYDAAWAPTFGKPLDKDAWTRVTQFVQLLSQQRSAGKAWNLKRIYFDEHGFASVRLAGGFHDATLVQLGGEEWAQKLGRARQSLDYLQASGRRAIVLNLITYAMPVWTPRASAIPLQTSGAQPTSANLRSG